MLYFYIFGGFILFYIILFIIFRMFNNKQSQKRQLKLDNFLKENPNAAKVIIKDIQVLEIDNEKSIVDTFEKRTRIIYLKPGTHKVNVVYSYIKSNILLNSKTHVTIGPSNVEINVRENLEYILSYDNVNNKFQIVEKENNTTK